LLGDIEKRYDARVSTVLTRSSQLVDAARRLAEAECALHAARQSHVDPWIKAAADKLHEAAVAYAAALNGSQPAVISARTPASPR
jgi:hypothetical protein